MDVSEGAKMNRINLETAVGSPILAHHKARVRHAFLLVLLCLPLLLMGETLKPYEQLLADSVTHGKVVWLQTQKGKFLGIFERAVTPQVVGAVIIVPDQHETANSYVVVAPLRQGIPNMGWSSLSISPPLASNKAFDVRQQDIFSRINAGIDYLKQKGYNNILLLGHGTGGGWAALYTMDNKRHKAVKGLVLLSGTLPAGVKEAERTNRNIAAISVPILDLYGSLSGEKFLKEIKYRLVESRRLRKDKYWGRIIHGADFNYHHEIPSVIKSIRAWLLINERKFKMERNNLK